MSTTEHARLGITNPDVHFFDIAPAKGRPVSIPGMLAGLILIVASFQLNATMLSPAIGDMAKRLNTNPGVIGWSSTVFLAVSAALAIFLPPWADKFGRKRALHLSVTLMIVGTIIALLAPNATWLIVGRALQGFCGATFALANLTLRSVLHPRQFGVYMALVAACNSGVGGFDTLLGGIVADVLGFRGIMAIILLV